MARGNRKRGAKKPEHPELNLDVLRLGIRRTEVKRGVEYTVQSTSGRTEDGEKQWICPHCNLTIQQAVAHTVAWDAHRGLDTRRHFHNACWQAWQGSLL
jgi:hypothetical protein